MSFAVDACVITKEDGCACGGGVNVDRDYGDVVIRISTEGLSKESISAVCGVFTSLVDALDVMIEDDEKSAVAECPVWSVLDKDLYNPHDIRIIEESCQFLFATLSKYGLEFFEDVCSKYLDGNSVEEDFGDRGKDDALIFKHAMGALEYNIPVRDGVITTVKRDWARVRGICGLSDTSESKESGCFIWSVLAKNKYSDEDTKNIERAYNKLGSFVGKYGLPWFKETCTAYTGGGVSLSKVFNRISEQDAYAFMDAVRSIECNNAVLVCVIDAIIRSFSE